MSRHAPYFDEERAREEFFEELEAEPYAEYLQKNDVFAAKVRVGLGYVDLEVSP